jgi:hypothetical protein
MSGHIRPLLAVDLYGAPCTNVSGFAMLRTAFTLRLIRADICPNAMDAIAVEVAWSRCYHQAADDDPIRPLPHIPLRARSLEPSFSGLHS